MMKKLLLTTALVASFGISAANATSINGIISGMDNLLSDNSAEYLINADGGNDTTLDLGDRLRGILGIDTIENTNGSHILSAGSNTELTAIFDVTITAKDCSSGTCFFEFGPTASFQAELAAWGFSYGGTDAAVAFFEDTTPDFDRGANGIVTVTDGENTATDGNAFWLFGFDNIDDYWLASSVSDDIANPLGPIVIPENTDFGDFGAALTLLENPFGQDINERTCLSTIGGVTFATADTCAIGNLLTPTGATPFDSFDDVNFVIDAVPEPASLGLLGLGLMGIGFAARRRK